jgi:hypothetical protein
MKSTAAVFRETQFLVFTKKVDLLLDNPYGWPDNLQVLVSRWPGIKATPETEDFRQAWMLDPKNVDDQIPKGVFECPGSCESCKYCFEHNGDVLFHKH